MSNTKGHHRLMTEKLMQMTAKDKEELHLLVQLLLEKIEVIKIECKALREAVILAEY